MNPGSAYQNSQRAATSGLNNPQNGMDWTSMLSALFQGTGGGLSSITQQPYHGGKAESQEARRRTTADSMRRSMNRGRSRMQGQHQNNQQGQDLQNEIMREMAQGFIESMRGGM